ncbi:MAG: CPBP family intramembrane glutamic endopeptidase [Nitrososphaeria archaeon]
MEVAEFFDKAFLPLLVTFVYIALYFYRIKIFNMIKKHVSKKPLLEAIQMLANNFRFNIGKFWLTILIPMILAILLDVGIMFIFQLPMKPYPEPFWFGITIRSFFNPISEEVLVRGFIFGAFFLSIFPLIEKLYKIKINQILKHIWVVVSLFLQAIVFATSHENPALFNWTIRISSGLLYGGLYLAYKKNLLPSIAAHITHNLVILLAA